MFHHTETGKSPSSERSLPSGSPTLSVDSSVISLHSFTQQYPPPRSEIASEETLRHFAFPRYQLPPVVLTSRSVTSSSWLDRTKSQAPRAPCSVHSISLTSYLIVPYKFLHSLQHHHPCWKRMSNVSTEKAQCVAARAGANRVIVNKTI